MELEIALEEFKEIINHLLNDPIVGIAFLVIVFLIALIMVLRDTNQPKVKIQSIVQRMNLKSRDCPKTLTHNKIQNEQLPPSFLQNRKTKTSSLRKDKLSYPELKEKVKSKYLTNSKRSLIYITKEEKEEQEKREKQYRQQVGRIHLQQMREKEEKKKKKEEQLRKKEQQKKEEEAKRKELEAKAESQKSVRSNERKTTIQKTVEENGQKEAQEKKNETQSQSLINGSKEQFSQFPSIFNNTNAPKIPQPSSLFASKEPSPSLFTGPNITSIKTTKQQKPILPVIVPQVNPPKQAPKQSEKPKVENPLPNPPSTNTVPPKPSPSIKQQKLTPEQYLETIMKFAQPQTIKVEISTIMANLGGAKSSLNDLLIFAQSFIDTVNKADDNQLTTFAVKIYEGIVRQISTSNLKDGIYRIPPKSKTDQVQKNSINCYILYINLYRLMGYEKVWLIVFGKLLKLLEFVYKRKEDLKKYTELELLANKHLERRGEIQGKYLSRIDYLTYMLLGLTAYDPIMVFKQIEEKQPNVRESRQQVQSWGREWNYKEFWILIQLILNNKHDSYFKPIVYMNILSSLYPRIYAHKQNPQKFKAENQVYKLVLEQGKKYFSRFKTIKQLKSLQQSQQGSNFQYDGDNFVQGIKVLQSRLTVQKVKEFNIKLGDNNSNAREFQSKSNVFYYFCKEK